MSELNNPVLEEKTLEVNNTVENDENERILSEIFQLKEDVSYLRDLFVRRLNDDKQKNTMIQKLSDGATFAFVEPFLHDVILLLDRLEKSKDDFALSVYEELYGIINRRGVEKIEVKNEFNPVLYKAVRVNEDSEANVISVSGIIRNGYLFSGRVIRPAEVIVTKPFDTNK